MMMALAVVSILPSCTKNDEPETMPTIEISLPSDSIATHATVTFAFGGDVEIRPMTRASLTELNLTDVYVFDYVGGQLQGTTHQTASDASFGSPSLTVDYGDHTFYFVASRGDTPTIDGTTISWSKPSDTFWATATVTVSPSSASSQAVSLSRVATRLRITVNDEVPAGAAKFVITPAQWYYGIDYVSGAAAAQDSKSIVIDVPSSYVGTEGSLSASVFSVSGAKEWTSDVVITATDADGMAIGAATIKAVPLKSNRATEYDGCLFSAGEGDDVSLATQWDAPVTGKW